MQYLPNFDQVLKVPRRKRGIVVNAQGGPLPFRHFLAEQRRGAVAPGVVEHFHRRGASVIGVLNQLRQNRRA